MMISFQTAKMSSGVNVFDEHPGTQTYNKQSVKILSMEDLFENQN